MTPDDRMIRMAIEMTRALCGPAKAAQIEAASKHLASDTDWATIRWRSEVQADHEVDAVARGLSGTTVESALATARHLTQSERVVWAGLAQWVCRGARPTYRGQVDKGMHWVFGGWIEVTTGLGREAGHVKEWLDKVFGLGQYDQADIEATEAGAAAVRRAPSAPDSDGKRVET